LSSIWQDTVKFVQAKIGVTVPSIFFAFIYSLSNEHDHGALLAKLCSIPSYENPRSESLTTEERKTDIYGPTCMISWTCYTQLLYKNILHPKISLTVQHCNSHIL